MPMWNTTTVMQDLSMIPNVLKVENNGPGGDWDTDQVVIHLNGTQERIFVAGFDITDNIPNGIVGSRRQTQVPFVEVSDGLDSRGGLHSTNHVVAVVYIAVRQYFIDQGFEVVSTMKDYF